MTAHRHRVKAPIAATFLARVRSVDALGPLLALVALVLFVLHGFDTPLARDQALYAYSAQQVADGVAPYVSVLTRAGPFGHLVNGAAVLLAHALGTDEILTMRTVMCAEMVAVAWLLYVIGRDLHGSRLVGAFATLGFLMLQQILAFATDGPREKTTAVLLVTLVVLAVLRRRWLVAGATVALATLTWQPAFFLCAPLAAAVLVVLPRRDLVRGLLRFTAGGVATTLLFVVVFWSWGALDDFYRCFLLFNARYTSETNLIRLVHNHPDQMLDGYAVDIVVVLVGLVATVVIAARAVTTDRSSVAGQTLFGLGVAALVALAWTLFVAGQGWADSMFLAPVVALGFGGAVRGLTRLLTRLGAHREMTATAMPLGVLVLAALMVLTSVHTSVSTRTTGLAAQRRQVAALLAAAPPHATMASINAPQALVLGHLTDPNPYQMFVGGFRSYYKRGFPGGIPALRDVFATEAPTFIAVGNTGWNGFAQRLLDRDYTRIQELDYLLYVRSDVGAARISRLREALATVG